MQVDDNFVVMNKPHDLRMDGDHELTVQKLLLEWIEGSSLSDLKWVHQLDYATSGALAVARTRKMAGYASNSFEFRETHKEYLAIVEGHVNYGQWPEASKDETSDMNDAVEQTESKTNEEAANISEEHEAARDNNVRLYYEALQLALGGASSSSSADGEGIGAPDAAEMQALGQHPIKDFLNPKNPKLRKRLRKAMRCTEYLAKREEELGSKIMTAPPAKKKKETSSIEDYSSTVNVMRQVTADSPHRIERVQVDGKDAIYISASIAEVPGDFRMELGHPDNPGRASQTTLFVLAHKYYQGRPVTKVLMRPKSGRRHQLRLHTQAMGHPIVGDVTYGTVHAEAAERMMLHSYKLRIPVPRRKWNGEGAPPSLVDITAPAFFSTELDDDEERSGEEQS